MNALSRHFGCLARLVAALATSAALAFPVAAQVPEQEALNRAGELAYSRTVKAAVPRGTNVTLPPSAARMRQVMNRLVFETPAVDVPRRGNAWSFTALPGDTPRLDLYPGGHVIVNAGWIERLKLSDDELAAGFAHALAHLLLGQVDARALAEAGSYADPDPNRVALRLASAIDKSLRKAWTPAQEAEADRIAIELAARSGYDPRAAITFWHKVDVDGDKAFLDTHPMDAARVAAIEAQFPAALKLLAEAKARAAESKDIPRQFRRKGT